MCLTCWQHLLVIYTFKKYIAETERRIKIFSEKNNLHIDKNMLSMIKEFVIDEEDYTSEESEKELEENESFVMDRIQFEHSYIKVPVEMESNVSPKRDRKKTSSK